MQGLCELCGRWSELEKHHVFNGAYRKKSEKYELTVYLCHECHNEPPNGIHHNAEAARMLKKEFQIKAQNIYGWTDEQFMRLFGKNYKE